LRRGLLVGAASRDHRRHPPTGQSRPPGSAVIPAIGQQPLRSLAGASWRAGTPDGHRVQGRFPAGDLGRGCRVQGLRPAEVPAPSTKTIHVVPVPRLVLPPLGPLLRWRNAAIGNAFVPASLVRLVERGQDRPPPLQEPPALFPRCAPAPPGPGAAVSAGACTPWCPGPHDPAAALHTAPIVAPGTPHRLVAASGAVAGDVAPPIERW
jgi:hypothetical protein